MIRKLIPFLILASISSPAWAQFSYPPGVTQSQLTSATVSTLPIYTVAGTLNAPSHGIVGNCTLTAGVCTVTLTNAAVFTSTATYSCISSDQTLAATLSSISLVSGTQFTIYGLLTHTINFSCTGW